MTTDATTAPRPRTAREPINVKWHHSTFEKTLVGVQALMAGITMSVAIIGALYVHDEQEDRRQARITRAWTLLHMTQEDRFHNVGQVEALQSLHASGADLRRIVLESRYLQGLALPGVDLSEASLAASNLIQADLRRARLAGAMLTRVRLADADLGAADLRQANLIGAKLMRARLRGAALDGAGLSGADLTGADLRGARGLTAPQLAEACTDPAAPPRLPPGLAAPPPC